MTRPSEIETLYRGLRILLPEAWERFRTAIPATMSEDANLVEAYAS
jgi:proline iminopeptidase